MSVMAGIGALLILLGVFVLCVAIGLLVARFGPGVRASQQRERIEQEARFAQWRLQQVTSHAMQRLLDEARRSNAGR